MEARSRCLLVLLCVWCLHTSLTGEVRGQIIRAYQISPQGDANIGDNVELQCNTFNFSALDFFRWTRNGICAEAEIANNAVSNSPKYSVAVESNAQSARSEILTIFNVTVNDKYDYHCSAIDNLSGGQSMSISVRVSLLYFPSDMYPGCIPNGPQVVHEGTNLSMSCTSDEGNPSVDMDIMTTGLYTCNHVGRTLKLTVTEDDNGIRIQCKITSDGFPGWERSCFIGPLHVTPMYDTTDRTEAIYRECVLKTTAVPDYNPIAEQSSPTLYIAFISNLAALLAMSLTST